MRKLLRANRKRLGPSRLTCRSPLCCSALHCQEALVHPSFSRPLPLSRSRKGHVNAAHGCPVQALSMVEKRPTESRSFCRERDKARSLSPFHESLAFVSAENFHLVGAIPRAVLLDMKRRDWTSAGFVHALPFQHRPWLLVPVLQSSYSDLTKLSQTR
ncbi:hypothetical protein VTK56DRAFT_7631 [Thermocarpiscus australiensis]